MPIKIGQIIKEKLLESGLTPTTFAKKIRRERATVYQIFERESIDTELLMIISRVLNHDFFKDLSDYLQNTGDRIINEPIKPVSEEEVNGWRVKYYETLEKYTALLERDKNTIIDFSKISMNEQTLP